ncbi:uncharacterized protein LOC117641261 [Thrips palmi]|uniref:Uncharacterized protein LOC117641261 n=1 Tax=Thrips palmi TaxID=161013 RepID=A0A6P8YD74_THRPL|nr:uncharacterized protein LOC117641261 [Thrips palmi]
MEGYSQHRRLRWPESKRVLRPRSRRKPSVVYEMMPLLWTLRFLLMLPVSINAQGSLRFKWVSLPTALTLAVWLLLAVLAYYQVRFHLDPVSDDRKHFHVWDLVLQYGAAISFSYVAFLPYTSWATAGRAVDLFGQWRRVEVQVATLREGAAVVRLRAWATALSVVCFAVPVVFGVGASPTTCWPPCSGT